MTARAPSRSRSSPDQAGGWGRLFAALLFAFYVNFIPAHLALETHLYDALAAVTDLHHDHHDGHQNHHHNDPNDSHTPHPASDHTLTLTASAKAPSASAFTIVLLPPITTVSIFEAEPQPPMPVFERSRPPGESPPDPFQPRAPPVA